MRKLLLMSQVSRSIVLLGCLSPLAMMPVQAQSSTPAAVPTETRPAQAVPSVPSPSPSTLQRMDRLDNSQRIGIGDRLSFRVIEDEDPVRLLQVKSTGEVEIPYVGLVTAQGKTSQQLAYEAKKLLEQDYYHQATVIISIDSRTVSSPGKVYLTGQIANEGPLAIPPDGKLYLSQAIIEAGGMGDFANQRKVKLIRKRGTKSSKTYIVDVKDIIQNGRRDKDKLLEPGDWIIVPQRLINF